MDDKHQYIDRDAGRSSIVLPEILSLCATTWPTVDLSAFKESYQHVTDFFRGENPVFNKNILPYHNLRHTRIVTLAAARIFHGLHHGGTKIRAVAVEKGLLCALFHDTGMLELRMEQHPFIDCKSTVTHEKRSAQLMRSYISIIGLPVYYSLECEEIINHTNLAVETNAIVCSNESKLIGQVVGSADVIAQMADRYYLECLSSLFYEMKKDDSTQFSTLHEMMVNTSAFYESIKGRLQNELGGVYHSLRHHFNKTLQVDRNVYMDQIDANVDYLNKIMDQCEYKDGKISKFLRRTPPNLENENN